MEAEKEDNGLPDRTALNGGALSEGLLFFLQKIIF